MIWNKERINLKNIWPVSFLIAFKNDKIEHDIFREVATANIVHR